MIRRAQNIQNYFKMLIIIMKQQCVFGAHKEKLTFSLNFYHFVQFVISWDEVHATGQCKNLLARNKIEA